MTKEQELDMLRIFIQGLGRDSYLGPWLQDQLPAIEHGLKVDTLVGVLDPEIVHARIEKNLIRSHVKQAAEQESRHIVERAKEERDNVIEQLQSALSVLS